MNVAVHAQRHGANALSLAEIPGLRILSSFVRFWGAGGLSFLWDLGPFFGGTLRFRGSGL